MVKYTHTENSNYMSPLTVVAVEAGFLQPNQRLDYTKGNSSYAVPTRIRVQELVRGEVGEFEWRYISQPTWVPEFSWKEGPSTVGRTLEVMANMFQDIIRRKQEAK